MDRVATLITRADYLRRHIYASIPFADRLAAFLLKFADSSEVLGRMVGAEMLIKGVEGMPDPGPRWNPSARKPADTLPSNYLGTYARQAVGLLMRKFHDPSLVDDTVSRFVIDKLPKLKAQPLGSAQSWVTQGLVWLALDIIKEGREERETTESIDAPGAGDEEGPSLHDAIEDPDAFNAVKRELSPRVWKLWMEFLAKHIHADIPLYIALSMQGYSPQEIIGHPAKGTPGMLPHYTAPASGFTSFYKYKVGQIPEVSRKFFESIHEEMPISV